MPKIPLWAPVEGQVWWLGAVPTASRPARGLSGQPPAAGVNATADATNRLTMAADATLLTHAGAGNQLKLNKADAAATGSLLYQAGFSGWEKMEMASHGGVSITVSADGTIFIAALLIACATGQVMAYTYHRPRRPLCGNQQAELTGLMQAYLGKTLSPYR